MSLFDNMPMNLVAEFNPHSNELDQALLRSRTPEAQEYRKALLRGRWAVIVACGFELTKFPQYYHLISEHVGFDRIFILEDGNNPLAHKLVQEGHGRIIHVPVNLKSRPTLVDECVEAITQSVYQEAKFIADNNLEVPNQIGNSEKGYLSAMFTVWDDAVCLASRIQARMGLNGDRPEVIDVCHDKLLARMVLNKAGVRGPASFKLSNMDDAKRVSGMIKYPCILKPINGAASIGVSVIKNGEELVNVFAESQIAMDKIYADEELMGLTFEDGPQDGATRYEDLRNFVAEEFIHGKEYDCDLIISEGECVYGNINEDWEFKDGWLCERGMHHPADLNNDDYKTLWSTAADCAKKLGCTTGIFHVEMKWDPDLGPQMIECNPRMGGAAVWQLHRNSWDCDLLLEASFCAIGIPSRPVILDEEKGTCVSLILFSDKGGVLREDCQSYNEDRILKKYKSVADGGIIDYLCVPMKKGETVLGWDGKVYPSHLGRLDLFYPKSMASKEEAIKLGKSMRSEVIIPLQDGDHYDEW